MGRLRAGPRGPRGRAVVSGKTLTFSPFMRSEHFQYSRPSRRVRASAVGDQMLDDGGLGAEVEGAGALLDVLVGVGDPLVLAQVLDPRLDQEDLGVELG